MLLYSNHPKMLIVLLLFVCPSETTLAAATAASTTSTNYCPQAVTATRQCQSSSSSSSSSSSMITHNVLAMTRGGSTEEEEEEGDAVVTDTNNTKQMDDDDENEATKTTEDADNNLTVQATQLRLEGKEYHDQGEFASAAKLFGEAADLWLVGRRGNNIHDDAADAAAAAAAQAEEYATCRLHQSLCCLKSQEYQGCVEACTSVLGDEEENNDDEASSSSSSYTSNPVLRARAYHRRSKAKLGLGDSTGALRDARSAAFLGDRKAVAFYGRLMRESSSSSSSGSTSGSSGMGGDVDSLASLLSSSSSSSPNAALLESLLNKSNNNNNNATPSSFGGLDPTSLLMGSGTNSFLAKALGGGKGKKGDESGGLAKSLLSSLVKRLEEDSTQTLISNTLQNTNPAQLQSLVGMAGMEIPEQHLDRMVGVCHKVTPKTIQRTLKMGRRVVYVGKVGRKISKILQKYKSLIVAVCIWKWTKSAYCRPIPMDRKAAKRASKLALKQALKDNRKNGPAAAAAAAAAGGGRAAL